MTALSQRICTTLSTLPAEAKDGSCSPAVAFAAFKAAAIDQRLLQPAKTESGALGASLADFVKLLASGELPSLIASESDGICFIFECSGTRFTVPPYDANNPLAQRMADL
ncbi:hypothetical protein [Mesorhizobium sp. M0579]|uniref:hypothetical protein n=1 Tax=Mesorhizobium sp. M0579 TaxID=2956962 RepID=UPI00333593DC